MSHSQLRAISASCPAVTSSMSSPSSSGVYSAPETTVESVKPSRSPWLSSAARSALRTSALAETSSSSVISPRAIASSWARISSFASSTRSASVPA